MGGVQALSREEVFWIFIQAVSNRSTRSLPTLDDNIIGILLDYGG